MNSVGTGSSNIAVSRAAIGFATSGGQTIVASAANASIRVLGWNVVTATTNALTWFSGSSAGSTLAGPYHFAANGGISVPVTEFGWMQTTGAGIPLVLKGDVASSVGGNIVYIQSSAI